jgi:hypothetical protein
MCRPPRSVLRCCVVAAAAAYGAAAPAAADPLRSTACRDALAALDVHERAIAPAPTSPAAPPDARLLALRRAAARTCLGARGDAPPPRGAVVPPPGAFAAPPSPVAPPPGPAAQLRIEPVRPPAPTAPSAVTSCDPQGCWTSDGQRLQRHGPGPDLLGPRGVCSRQGTLLHCP